MTFRLQIWKQPPIYIWRLLIFVDVWFITDYTIV